MHVTEDVIVINEKDSVAVAVRQLAKHEAIDIGGRSIVMMDDISVPHKIALKKSKKTRYLQVRLSNRYCDTGYQGRGVGPRS